jgi:type III pantothenate kinase
MSNNLIIDWGNTRVKLAVFSKGHLIQQTAVPKLSADLLQTLVPEFEKMHVLLCSVSHESDELADFLITKTANFIKLSHETPLPIEISYKTPQTLGYDRIANAVGAFKLSNGKNHCLVIDAGTCLKIDFLHAEQGYLGGSISPGLEMRYKALNNYTSALPLINNPEESQLIGDSTIQSINSGVLNGMRSELTGMIAQYQNLYNNLTIFITGGDAHFFEKALKNDIFAHVFLTLVGLNEILDFNKAT